MRSVFLVMIAATLAACGSGMTGEYGGKECGWGKLSFKGDGTVYMTVMGMEQSLQYKVDGDKISIGVGGQGVVFKKNGDTLDGGMLGKCKKL